MLFRNTKSGNIVGANDKASIELMQRSPIYEAVETAPAPAPKGKPKAPDKSGGKDNSGDKAE